MTVEPLQVVDGQHERTSPASPRSTPSTATPTTRSDAGTTLVWSSSSAVDRASRCTTGRAASAESSSPSRRSPRPANARVESACAQRHSRTARPDSPPLRGPRSTARSSRSRQALQDQRGGAGGQAGEHLGDLRKLRLAADHRWRATATGTRQMLGPSAPSTSHDAATQHSPWHTARRGWQRSVVPRTPSGPIASVRP